MVFSGYGSECPSLHEAVAKLQQLLPRAALARHTATAHCTPSPPSATTLPTSLACSMLGRIGGMINVASGHIQALPVGWLGNCILNAVGRLDASQWLSSAW
jgi:hypothetical protein